MMSADLAPVGGNPLIPLLIALAILISTAKLLGALAIRFGQPGIVGELAAGLILGPSVLGVFSAATFQQANTLHFVEILGEIGVIFLMFTAGLEIDLSDLRQAGRPAILTGVLGVLLPFSMGAATGLLFGASLQDAILLGIILSATSVSISAQTLLEIGKLRTREGITLLGAAVIDDLLVIVGLSAYLAIIAGTGSAGAIVLQIARMLATLVGALVLARFVMPWLASWSARLTVSEALLASVLASILFFAWIAEAIGAVAGITGAFIAGLSLNRSHLREEIESGLHSVMYAFFVPLFLVSIGLRTDLSFLAGPNIGFAIAVLMVALLSKLVGGGMGSLAGGMGLRSSLRIGTGMISRGEVGLIVAGIGVAEGLLGQGDFSIIVLTVLVSTLITPVLLRWVYTRTEVRDD
jgi:Kef-type K+ transport system membrane component KefB